MSTKQADTVGDYDDTLVTSFRWRYENAQDFWTMEQALHDAAAEIFRDLPGNRSATVLDVGIGAGASLEPVLNAGHHVTGLDLVEPPAWSELRARWGDRIELIQTHFMAWDGPLRHFDFVSDLGCLHHQQEAEYPAYLRKIASHLEIGGRFGLCVYEEPAVKQDKGHTETTDHGRLARYFTEAEIRPLLTDAGIRVERAERIFRPKLNHNYLVLVGTLE